MRLQNLTGTLVVCLIVFGVASLASASFVEPFSCDFSGGATDVAKLSVGSSNTSAVSATAGTNVLGNPCYAVSATKNTSGSLYAWESAQVTGLSSTAGSSFTISGVISNLSDSDSVSANATAGIRFLADTASSNGNAFVVDINDGKAGNAGRVRLVNWVGGTAAVYPNSSQANQYLIGNYSAAILTWSRYLERITIRTN